VRRPGTRRGALVAAILAALAAGRAGAAPSVAIAAPAAGALLAGIVDVSASVSPPAEIAGVQFLLDGADLGARLNAPPFVYAWNTAPAPGGAHVLGAVAWDLSGSSAASAAVSVVVDNTPPSVVVMNPAAGVYVSSGVTVSVNASDNVGVASVQFMLDGAEIGPPETAPPYSVAWNTTLVNDGAHTVGAVARDGAGNGATAVVSVIVSNTPPVIGVPAIGSATPNRVDILWSTDQRADSAVDYGPTPAYGNSTPVIAAQSTGHGVSVTGLAAGTAYHYRVRSRNAAGLASASPDYTFSTPGVAAAAPGAAAPAAADESSAAAPQKFLTPATPDGINDKAVFGPAALEVWIYDLRGRQVFHASASGPSFPVVWDCKDPSGRVVASGVYVAKIRTSDSRLVYQSFAVAK
jgi:hypothetical protein